MVAMKLPFDRTKVKIEPYKKGRRTYGSFCESIASGRKFYLAHRRIAEVFRSGESTITEAVQKDTACWAIDEETLTKCRARGVDLVGVIVKETGDIYLAPRQSFFDPSKRPKVLNYEARGGALQRYLPLSSFSMQAGKVKVR